MMKSKLHIHHDDVKKIKVFCRNDDECLMLTGETLTLKFTQFLSINSLDFFFHALYDVTE